MICRGSIIKFVDEQTSTEANLINSNTGSSCGITCSSVAIPRIVLPALVMAADGLDLPSVSLNIADKDCLNTVVCCCYVIHHLIYHFIAM